MKTFQSIIIFACASVVVAADGHAATEPNRCSELVKECFAYSGQERDTCFDTSSKHSYCEGTETGALAATRSQFSLLNPDSGDVGPSFLGTQLIDRACVANFDNAWSGVLIKGTQAPGEYNALLEELQSCAHAPASDMIRP
jgi:hypothetical protein